MGTNRVSVVYEIEETPDSVRLYLKITAGPHKFRGKRIILSEELTAPIEDVEFRQECLSMLHAKFPDYVAVKVMNAVEGVGGMAAWKQFQDSNTGELDRGILADFAEAYYE